MPNIGFNAINEIALEQLHQEEILVMQRDTMIDVCAFPDYRIWKNKDTGMYYYMFKDKGRVYCAVNEIGKDYRSSPPTQMTRCVLMPVDDALQGSFRDILLAHPPDMHIEEGGVLK